MLNSFESEVEKRPEKKSKKRKLDNSTPRTSQNLSGGPSSDVAEDSGSAKDPSPTIGRAPRVDFLVVGMQKAGTSWMYKMFEDHPSIALSKEKEVHYWDMHFKKDDSWYESQFPDDIEGKVVGEVTPDYLSMWMEKVRE